jgi:glycosyltransferase involved in cell wall biosynthesis
MNLRIAYMTGEYPRATDTFIQREVIALRQRGVHVETFSIRRPAEKETVGPDVAAERQHTFYVLNSGFFSFVWAHFSLAFSKPLSYLAALGMAMRIRPPGLKALARQLAYFLEAGVVARRVRRHRLGHLHNHFSNSSCSVAMLAARMGSFSFSFTMHGPSEFFAPEYWRVKDKIHLALFVNTISHFCRSQAMIFAPHDKWDRLHIVHCGVNLTDFPPRSHTLRGSQLLFVGRLAPVKGVPILLEALASLLPARPDIKLTLVGDGPDRSALEQQAEALGISQSVEFLGYQSQAKVRQLLASTDVFVLPSFAEGVPVVLMEAMAAGVPVVATKIAGIPELVEGGVSGFLVMPGDAKSLATRIGELLDHPDMRNRFGAAGRAKVDREFDIESEAAWLCEIMTQALGGEISPVRKEPPDPGVAIDAQPAVPASTAPLAPAPPGV